MTCGPAVRDRSVATALAVLALVAASCAGAGPRSPASTAPKPRPATAPTPSVTPSTVASTAPATTAPVPPVGWLPCSGGLECGWVDVPLDYRHPEGRVIAIALARHRAGDPAHRIGSLVLNPGGPGDSGINDLPTELRVLTPDLLARFDVVSFDPRGVERSAPIHCSPGGVSPSPASLGPVPDPVPQNDAARRALLAADQAYAHACGQNSGDLLAFVGTVDVARDLDRIRAGLGDQRLTFLGHSYGTLLGATYAELFPDRVRAMVLDGAIDPALSTDAMSLAQAKGFEASLDGFFAWCGASSSCLWRPSGDRRTTFMNLLGTVRARPLPVGTRTVGPGELLLGVLSTLYSQSFWPSLGRALAGVGAGDGGQMLALSDGYQTHGSSNAADSNAAITCLDHPVSSDPATYPQRAAAAAAEAPVFGPMFAWGALQCAAWPVGPTRQPHAIRAQGAPAILVVGTTGDPATPYSWAVSLASQLDKGVLVGRTGVDHVAYFYSACIRQIDARYLIDGIAPPTSTVCPA